MKKFFLLFCLSILGTVGSHADSQQTVSLNMRNAAIGDVLQALEKQTSHTFFYDNALFDTSERLVVEADNEDFAQLLSRLLSPRGLSWQIDDTVVIISRQQPQSQQPQGQVTITGRITNADGGGLPGASINIKGQPRLGVSADANGRYRFRFTPRQGTVLVFSFMGMQSHEVVYEGAQTLNITLHEQQTTLDAVVVDGYQSIPKHQATASFETIKLDSMGFDGSKGIEQLLQGKIAGLVISTGSGLVGSRSKVRLRGTSTVLGNPNPVWVVDGIVQTDPLPFSVTDFEGLGPIGNDNFDMIANFVGSAISWLNPNDIEDITVLKDAQATVLYGTNAANGVILITTRKGKMGRMSVNYSGNVSFSPRPTYERYNMMNSQERIDVSREAYNSGLIANTGLQNVGYEGLLKQYLNKQIGYDEFNSGVKILETMNTDWLGILGRTPVNTNHSVSISGGNEDVTYYSSLGARTTSGNMRGNDQKAYTGSLRMQAHITPKLLADVSLNGSYSKTSAFYGVDPFNYALRTSRAIPAYDENGEYYFYRVNDGNYKYSILNELDNRRNQNTNTSVNIAANVRWEPVHGLRLSSRFGMSVANISGYSYATELTKDITEKRGYEYATVLPGSDAFAYSRLPYGGVYTSLSNKSRNWTWNNQADWNHNFDDKHSMGALVAIELNSEKYDGYDNTRYGYLHYLGRSFTDPPLNVKSESSTGSVENDIYGDMTQKITDRLVNKLGLLASVNYAYDNRFSFMASARSDASNRFGQYKRYRFLPAWTFSGRWNVSRERWMENQRIVTDLYFTGSYGLQGKMVESASPDLIAYIPGSAIDIVTGQEIAKIRSLAYGDLQWEKTHQVNLAMVASLFDNKVNIHIDYYRKKTKDLIISYELPVEYGVATMPINSGSMLNYGWEFRLGLTPIRTNNWVWNLSFNTGINKNTLKKTVHDAETWKVAATQSLIRDGYDESAFWLFDYQGVNPENGLPVFNIPTEVSGAQTWLDPTSFMVYAGVRQPRFSGGVSTSLRYKTWTLSTSFNVALGHHRLLYPIYGDNVSSPSAEANLDRTFVDRWRQPGDQTDIPRLPYVGASNEMLIGEVRTNLLNMYDYSTARLVKASYVRCNSISLGYSLPSKIVERFKLQNLQVSASLSNPFVIANKAFNGMDPETGGQTPIMRTVSINLNIGF